MLVSCNFQYKISLMQIYYAKVIYVSLGHFRHKEYGHSYVKDKNLNIILAKLQILHKFITLPLLVLYILV